MNEKLVEIYFSRRKETGTRLLLCLSVSGLLAVASRIPILLVSLPASWISGGLSVGFIWVVGPFVVLFFQAFALQSQVEAEGLRQLLVRSTFSETSPDQRNSISEFKMEELAPQWKRDLPVMIRFLTALFWLAPVVVNVVFFASFLDFVRPDTHQGWRYPTRAGQLVDAFCGTGGWNWFQPLAPSLQGNLENFRQATTNSDEREKYRRLQQEIPWIIYPAQTWLYLFLMLASIDSAILGIEYARGDRTPRGLFKRLRNASDFTILYYKNLFRR